MTDGIYPGKNANMHFTTTSTSIFRHCSSDKKSYLLMAWGLLVSTRIISLFSNSSENFSLQVPRNLVFSPYLLYRPKWCSARVLQICSHDELLDLSWSFLATLFAAIRPYTSALRIGVRVLSERDGEPEPNRHILQPDKGR